MIRILHCVSNMDRAGIETMLMNYYRHIDREQVQFDFLCNKTKPGAYDEEIKSLGGHIFHTPGVNPIKAVKYQKYMKNFFREHPEYKILHCHNGAFGVYALYAAKKAGIPVRIYHCHGASLIKDFKYPLKLICMKFLKYNYNHRWTCGEAAARFYFGDKIVEKKEYRLITNAIQVEKYVFNSDTRDYLRKKYGLEDCKVIGHVGRFMTQKNHTFIIDVFSEIFKKDNRTKLVLLGDGNLMESIKQKVNDKGIADAVLFLGNIENANEWYQAFDVFILPSLYEGLPVVGIEAQASGLPCVFSTEVTREVAISEHVAFLDLKEKKSKWADTILTMMHNLDRQDESDTVASANYDVEAEAKKLQSIYQQLQNGKNVL